MRRLVLCFGFLSACGDDSATGGAGGGTGGSGGADARLPDANPNDAFIRGDGGFPMNIGAPCDPDGPGICWMLPTTCPPDDGPPVQACGPGAPCVGRCAAMRTQKAHHDADPMMCH